MEILDRLKTNPTFQEILKGFEANQSLVGLGLPRAARLPVFAALFSDLKRPFLLITDRADHAIALVAELRFWLDDVPVYLFAEPTPLFYEDASWGNLVRNQRLQVLSLLASYHVPGLPIQGTPPVIVTSSRALMTRSISRQEFVKSVRKIHAGEGYQLELLLRGWVDMGYSIEDTVLEGGQLCRRGGIIDIWPPAMSNPVRLEFFGNTIDTIRIFDPGSQRTIEEMDSFLVTPAREFIPANNVLLKEKTNYSEFHIPLLHPYTSNILDYFPPKSGIVLDDMSLIESGIYQFEEQAVKLRKELTYEGLLENNSPIPYFTWDEINESLQKHPWLEMGYSTIGELQSPSNSPYGNGLQFDQIEHFGGRIKNFIEYLVSKKENENCVVVVSRQAARLEELWVEKIDTQSQKTITFIDNSLMGGWSLGKLFLLTDSEIFGWERPQPRNVQQARAELPDTSYGDIVPGDWIVHIDYGIGLFIGLVRRVLDGVEREYLCVEFKNNDQVFVPIYQADRLTKYIKSGGGQPTMGDIGTQAWSETKRRVQIAVEEVAKDLLELYARRMIATGYAYQPDTPWQAELESSFPYFETPDQSKAIQEIKNDMQNPRPMDRLLCGDVGYGKTEVALRAAFKAVMDGKQVAVLVPTTVLAQQHFHTFQHRLSAFPVSVDMLSRFRTTHEQENILKALQKGNVDIIIGTHRLISSDVRFKDLGLVIIDEEQRFGVTHKERFKLLRAEVDVLTLTATPIPRTLYMALTGVRDISNLNTPPEERLPIVTHIGPYSPKLVRQAVMRELERGGQVFFVHNRVQTIHAMKMHLEKIIPEARIAIGHGQMPEHELASVMNKFTSGGVDILLTTSIIESGLDIPNANTLIVDRGDTFGLAQLYQLRGRVGRGAVRAYAYFFRHKKLAPTLEGQERLEIIAENTKLGSGYSIAMRDLEMRGAGDLLGTRQSGHIAAVGFHLYTRLLAYAVRTLRPKSDLHELSHIGDPRELDVPVSVDLPQTVSIPEEYISDNSVRLRLYRRIADIPDELALNTLQDEFIDRFGTFPLPVKNLFFQMRVKLRAEMAQIASVGFESGQIVLRYQSGEEGKNSVRLPDLAPGVRGGKNAYWCNFGKDSNWEEKLLNILSNLAELKLTQPI